MTRTAIVLACLAVAAFAGTAGAEQTRPRPTDSLNRLYYLYGVALECGLADDAVMRGFVLAANEIVVSRGLTEVSVRATRIQAWIAVDLEWSNRGLGGYRNWCRTEGAGAADLFRAVNGAVPPP